MSNVVVSSAREIRNRLWNPPNGRVSSELEVSNEYLLKKDRRIEELSADLAIARRRLANADIEIRSLRYQLERSQSAETYAPLAVGETITLQKVIGAVCREYNVSPGAILSERRIASISLPRKVVYYIAKNLTRLHFAQIGRRLNRDHTTVICGCRSIQKAVDSGDEELIAKIAAIKKALAA